MQITLKSKSDNHYHLEVKANEEQLTPLLRQVFNQLRPDVKAAGFRPGRAPNEIVERELGAQRIQAEVIELVAQKAYAQALKEQDFTPLEPPTVNLQKFVPYSQLEMSIEVETLPPVKLADYKKIKKQLSKTEVTDTDIKQVLEGLRIRAATRTDVKRAAKNGDEVLIDFNGSQNGKPVTGASAKNYPLMLGSNRLVKGFEEQLIGLKAGIEKKFTITFPKDYFDQSMRNQKVDFETKVHKVIELKLPKVDDKFAVSVGPFKKLTELKEDIKKQIKAEKDGEVQRQLQNDVVEELVNKSQVAVPASLLEKQLQQMQHDFEHELEGQGTNLTDYLKQQKKTAKDMEASFRPIAERRIKTGIVLNEVAKAEKLDITPEELEIRLQLVKGQYKDAQVQEQLERPEVKRDIANQLMTEKTLAKLVEYATKGAK